MNLTEDKTRATLAINGTWATTGLEKLIGDLLVLRANMLPPVPYKSPHADQGIEEAAHVSVQNDPYFSIRRVLDGGLRIYLRNEGLGWMVFNVTAAKATAIRDWLAARIPGSKLGAEFFSDETGDGSTRQ